MSAEVKDVADAHIKLVAGGGGVFDVRRDGELVFSKLKEHRFPSVGEIAQLL